MSRLKLEVFPADAEMALRIVGLIDGKAAPVLEQRPKSLN